MQYKFPENPSQFTEVRMETNEETLDKIIHSIEENVISFLTDGENFNFKLAINKCIQLISMDDISFFNDSEIIQRIFFLASDESFDCHEYLMRFLSISLRKRQFADLIIKIIPDLPSIIRNYLFNPRSPTLFRNALDSICSLSFFCKEEIFNDLSLLQNVLVRFLIAIDEDEDSTAERCLDYLDCFFFNNYSSIDINLSTPAGLKQYISEDNHRSYLELKSSLQFIIGSLNAPHANIREAAMHSIYVFAYIGLSHFLLHETSTSQFSPHQIDHIDQDDQADQPDQIDRITSSNSKLNSRNGLTSSNETLIGTVVEAAYFGNEDAQKTLVCFARDIPGALYETGIFDSEWVQSEISVDVIKMIRFMLRGEGVSESTITSTLFHFIIFSSASLSYQAKFELSSCIGVVLESDLPISHLLLELINEKDEWIQILNILVVGVEDTLLPEVIFALSNLVTWAVQNQRNDVIDCFRTIVAPQIEDALNSQDSILPKIEIICNA